MADPAQEAGLHCSQVAQKLPGPLAVSAYTCGLPFADFDGGGSEVNQTLDETGFGSRPAEGVPEALPHFMSLPVETPAIEVDGVEPPGVSDERSGKGTAPRIERIRQGIELGDGNRRLVGEILAGIEVADRMIHRVRQVVARNIAVGRERDGRGVAWLRHLDPAA